MINKIYEEIKKNIKENYKIFMFFVVLMILFLVEFPYYIQAPGGIIKVDDRIDIENKSQNSGSFNLAYVSEVKATIPTLIYAWINDDWDIVSKDQIMYENETIEDANYRNHLLLEEANNNAIVLAYKSAGKEIIVSNEHLYVIYVDNNADTNLKVGDEILKVDGIQIINKEQLDELMLTKKIGDVLEIVVKREQKEIVCYGKIQKLYDKKAIGLALSKTSNIETNPDINLKFKSSESGPSGGFILALSIYNSLINEDITNGLKIVGTGTIDLNGKVGTIGGIEYKIKGAVKESADVFLVPMGENYEDAKKIISENNYELKLIPVESFSDAIKKLSLLND